MAALRQLLRLNCKRISGGLGYARPAPPPRPPTLPPAALGFRTFTSGTSNAAVRQQRLVLDETAAPRYRRHDDDPWTLIFTDILYNRLFMLTLDIIWIVLPGAFMIGKLVDQWNAAAARSHSPPAPPPSDGDNSTDHHSV